MVQKYCILKDFVVILIPAFLQQQGMLPNKRQFVLTDGSFICVRIVRRKKKEFYKKQ